MDGKENDDASSIQESIHESDEEDAPDLPAETVEEELEANETDVSDEDSDEGNDRKNEELNKVESSNSEHNAVVRIQSHTRMMMERKRFEEKMDSAVKIQSFARGSSKRSQFKKKKSSSKKLQAFGRGYIARKKYGYRLLKKKTERRVSDLKEEIHREILERQERKRLEKVKVVMEAELLNKLKREKILELEKRRKSGALKVKKEQLRLLQKQSAKRTLQKLQETNTHLLKRCKLAAEKIDEMIQKAKAEKKGEKSRRFQENDIDNEKTGQKEVMELDSELKDWFHKVQVATKRNQSLMEAYNTLTSSRHNEDGVALFEKGQQLDIQLETLKKERDSLKAIVHGTQMRALEELSKSSKERDRLELELSDQLAEAKAELRKERHRVNELKDQYEQKNSEPLGVDGYTNNVTTNKMHSLRLQNQKLSSALKHYQAAELGVVSPTFASQKSQHALRSPREVRIIEEHKEHKHVTVSLLSRMNTMTRRHERDVDVEKKRIGVVKQRTAMLQKERASLENQLTALENKVSKALKTKKKLMQLKKGSTRKTLNPDLTTA